jgi:hypothetical protein
MTNAVKERLDWFHRFMPLYERAAPLIRHIANLNRLQSGELPASPEGIIEIGILLRPVLVAVRKISKPKEKELVAIQKEFELALNNCIKAAEWTEKYIKRCDYSADGSVFLNLVINATVMAHEYIESVSKKVAPYLEQSNSS